jgi:hypothetical protein
MPPILLRLTVAVNAFPGDSPIIDPGVGDGGRPGEEDTADGGGDVPRREDRRPPLGEARMLLVVGTAGDPGTDSEAPVLGVTRPVAVEADCEERIEADDAAVLSYDPEVWILGRPVAEEKLDTDPARSFALRPLRDDALGVERS